MNAPTIDDAIEALRKLSPQRQAEQAGFICQLAQEAREKVDPAHLPAVLEGLDQAERGQFAAPERVAAAFRRFGK